MPQRYDLKSTSKSIGVTALGLAILDGKLKLSDDVGPGETSSIPTKWISRDGCEFHLIFSGDDHFSLRKARLTLAH